MRGMQSVCFFVIVQHPMYKNEIRMKCLHFRRISFLYMGRARREASLTAAMRNAEHSEWGAEQLLFMLN